MHYNANIMVEYNINPLTAKAKCKQPCKERGVKVQVTDHRAQADIMCWSPPRLKGYIYYDVYKNVLLH